ncbi:MAG: hypothetical protein MH112_03980 [Phenylobacterium sp.]|uniref:hypothetical protein n=1 Tax=Phenylobacterium sp. TaxID=1871053 RepID=UPI0025D3ABF4|nr:hypothetical protein [Phenylobacterium sp.]MCG9915506.1 hypothetical protein [Phenylobacterium sp.]
MARTKLNPEFPITVDGDPYVWRLQRQPQWSSDTAGWRGMALAVRHVEGQREAVVEFPPGPQRRYGAPQLQPAHISTDLVARAITSAIAAGWEPLSRGKTVAIVVDAEGR